MDAPTVSRRAYVLLARHAKAATSARGQTEISETGRSDLIGVADRLAETLDALTIVAGEEIRIAAVICGTSPIATETATIITKRLEAAGIDLGAAHGSPDLDGRHASPLSPGADAEQAAAQRVVLERLSEAQTAGSNAVLVVGHQPAIGIIGQNLSRGSVPLGHGAIACIKGSHARQSFSDGVLRWVIAPSDSTTMEHLRVKIASKMQVAGVLAGLVSTALIFVLQDLFATDRPLDLSLVLQVLAVLSLALAAALNLATVYAYDLLLMPTRFWAEPRRLLAPVAGPARSIRRTPRWLVWRPPSSDQLVVYQNMIRVWRWFFMPATALLVLGVAAMGLALVRAPDVSALIPWAALSAALGGLLLLYVRSYWPVLGVED